MSKFVDMQNQSCRVRDPWVKNFTFITFLLLNVKCVCLKILGKIYFPIIISMVTFPINVSGADPGWSILEGVAPPCPPSGSATVYVSSKVKKGDFFVS